MRRPARADARPRGPHGGRLVGEHRRRHGAVLDRERPTETAALAGVGQLGQVDARHRAQQPGRAVTDAQDPQRMAGGMVGDAVREVCSHVGDAQDVHQELGQLVGSGRDLLDLPPQRLVPRCGSQAGVLVPHGRRTGTGWHHDRLAAGEGPDVSPHQRQGRARIAAVDVHLPAAGLPGRHSHRHAEPVQQPDHGAAHLGPPRVDQAGDEQADSHAASSDGPAVSRQPPGARADAACPGSAARPTAGPGS